MPIATSGRIGRRWQRIGFDAANAGEVGNGARLSGIGLVGSTRSVPWVPIAGVDGVRPNWAIR
jgi:hypothetical protein